jgi:hypothetical protein
MKLQTPRPGAGKGPDAARAGPIAASADTLALATQASTARSTTAGSRMWDILELRGCANREHVYYM